MFDKTNIFEGLYGNPRIICPSEAPSSFQKIYTYFNRYFDKDVLPKRKDLNPADHKKLLPKMTLVNIKYTEDSLDDHITYAGSDVDDFFGSYSFQNMSNIKDLDVYYRYKAVVSHLQKTRQPLFVKVEKLTRKYYFYSATFAFLPFSEDGDSISQIVSIFQKQVKS
ncbi:PAS domain-containing protein [Temperatibacter marinus]|uniref:PAS domain-containing protein n=1 Tax=Temperatibacter marinus TaxID=1456591 RepID=A0AA52HBE8_9PROT|nr:PAS domain-containing protein [Temperatibacter marinus]WND03563.1 PAS domain-containing protein [Temperatibacter marinus]